MAAEPGAPSRWADALLMAECLARAVGRADAGLGGAVVRARPGPARDAWMDAFRGAVGVARPWRRLPVGGSAEALVGGLDLSATLAAGRPVANAGLLRQTDGGVLVVPMAERLSEAAAAVMAQALDRGAIIDAFGQTHRAAVHLLLLDEGVGDEAPPPALAERLAFRIDLEGLSMLDLVDEPDDPDPDAEPLDDPVLPLCAAAMLWGIGSSRAPLFALRTAQRLADRDGAAGPADVHLAAAARLVFAHRATMMPAPPADADQEPDAPPPPDQDAPESGGKPDPADVAQRQQTEPDLSELLVDSVRAALPPGLVAALAAGDRSRAGSRADSGGRGEGARGKAPTSGRPGVLRSGPPRAGHRLDIIETLKAAAPWQRARAASAGPSTGVPMSGRHRLHVRVDDLRVRRMVRRIGSTFLFVVDASGSAAMTRLGEAKGAAEMLLADAYVRRDDVAMIAFRQDRADIILPPTRSLARARRALADMVGGGGTPLASALVETGHLADAIRARGRTPLILLLTDGRANVDSEGQASGDKARTDALAAARALQLQGYRTLFIDTAPRPRPEALALAGALGARHIPLPRASSAALRSIVEGAR